MPTHTIEVDMDDIKFTSSKKTLITKGISTCIAFAIYGNYWDEDDNNIKFRGLYHWSGFGVSTANQDAATQYELDFFLDTLRESLQLEEEDEVNIDGLIFIGGEKKQMDKGEVVLSGTEAEVYSLIKTVQEFNFTQSCFHIDPNNIIHHHFLTTDNQSITVELMPHEWRYTIENENNEELSPPTESPYKTNYNYFLLNS